MKHRFLFILLIVIAVFFKSCQTKESKLPGIWYQQGLIETENTLFNESLWNSKIVSYKKGENLDEIDRKRNDLYWKYTFNKDHSFTQGLFVLGTNEIFERPHNGTWKLENNHLELSVISTAENASSTQVFQIDSLTGNILKMTLIKAQMKENDRVINDFDLAIKQSNFQELIKTIGINEPSIISSNIWEFNNYGTYQVLINKGNYDSSETQWQPIIKDIFEGSGLSNYVPYYDPLFENTGGRLHFVSDSTALIHYYSWGNGENDDLPMDYSFPVQWQWESKSHTISFHFNRSSTRIPAAIKEMFRNNNPQIFSYRIIASNKAIMVWEKIKDH